MLQEVHHTHIQTHHFPPTAAGFMSCCSSGNVTTFSLKSSDCICFPCCKVYPVVPVVLVFARGKIRSGGDEEVMKSRERERETPRQPRFVEASKEGKQTPRQSLETTKCLELSLFLGMAQDHVLHMSRFTKTSLSIYYGVFGW